VTFVEREGEAAYMVFQAPRSVPIFRDGRLSQRDASATPGPAGAPRNY
jgi:hypothetical protein